MFLLHSIELTPQFASTLMADPFSITAGVVGITAAALHSIKSLLEEILAIKDAPAAIGQVKQDLLAVEMILKTLNSAFQESAFETLSENAKASLQFAIRNCQKACDTFRTRLQKWTRHSGDGKIHWWDRVRVGLFAEAEMEVLSKQLKNCRDTVGSAVSTATLCAPTRCPGQ